MVVFFKTERCLVRAKFCTVGEVFTCSISIHFCFLSIGTITALGNRKGGDSGKKEKDDEGSKEAVFAESHPKPVLKTKCFLFTFMMLCDETQKSEQEWFRDFFVSNFL